MAYDNLTSRTDVAALIPEEVSNAMLANLEATSAARALFTVIPVPRSQTRFPVLSALPVAYFVNGDTGLKQTTELSWANKYLNIEEIAAILPVPDNVVADMDADVWGTAQPLLEQAIARVLDAAIFFGTNKPSSWPSAIVTAAVAAGNTTNGGATAAQGGIAKDINDVMALVEADGFDVNGFIASRTFRALLRSARDANGQRLLDINGNIDSVEGIAVSYAMAGLWPAPGTGATRLIAGDFKQGILGIRSDISFQMFREGVIQDNTGATMFNLMQQDMQAMRVTFRVGFQVANPINYDEPTEANRYPFAVLRTA